MTQAPKAQTQAEKTHTLRVPEPLYEALRGRAQAEQRSINNMAVKLLTLAVSGEIDVVTTPWPQPEAPVVKPSQAEKDFATGDPVGEDGEVTPWQQDDDPVPDPEPDEPTTFIPITKAEENAEHFRPDFGSKLGKKK